MVTATSLSNLALSNLAWSASVGDNAAVQRAARFESVAPQTTDALVLPKDYTFDLIARWGDSLFPGTASLTARDVKEGALLSKDAASRQERQFGANCDAVAYFPLDRHSQRSRHSVREQRVRRAGAHVQRPQAPGRRDRRRAAALESEKSARRGCDESRARRERHRSRCGGEARWQLQPARQVTRRITAETVMELSGPARGAALLRTKEDPTGTRVRGTFANCAGGKTPWGTYLTAEENIDDYFGSARTWASGGWRCAAWPRLIAASRCAEQSVWMGPCRSALRCARRTA